MLSIIVQQPVIDTKSVHCSYEGCSDRRAHHDRPNERRSHQEFWVPANQSGPYYCSIECSVYDKAKKELVANDTPETETAQPTE